MVIIRVVSAPSGAGDKDMAISDIFVCLVTNKWMNDNGCWGQAEYAQKLGKYMVAIIKNGTKHLENIDRFPWKKKYYWSTDAELKTVTEEVLKLDGGYEK